MLSTIITFTIILIAINMLIFDVSSWCRRVNHWIKGGCWLILVHLNSCNFLSLSLFESSRIIMVNDVEVLTDNIWIAYQLEFVVFIFCCKPSGVISKLPFKITIAIKNKGEVKIWSLSCDSIRVFKSCSSGINVSNLAWWLSCSPIS